MAGFGLHWLLPAAYLAAFNGMISSIVGLTASLLSIVLGLLVWTAYGQMRPALRRRKVSPFFALAFSRWR